MSKLFSKLSTQVQGLLHDLVDSVSDDGRTARQLIREMGDNEDAIRDSLVEARTQSILAKQKVEAKQADILKASERAAKAVKLGKEDLARTILTEKKTFTSDLAVLQAQYDKLEEIVKMLAERFTEFQKKRSVMESKADSIELRGKVAEATENATKLLDTSRFASSDNAMKAFDKLEENIAKKEARSQAQNDLYTQEKSREDELAALDRDDVDEAIEDELAALRALAKQDS